jgi:hypothetical protein
MQPVAADVRPLHFLPQKTDPGSRSCLWNGCVLGLLLAVALCGCANPKPAPPTLDAPIQPATTEPATEPATTEELDGGVVLKTEAGAIIVTIAGRPFTEYRFTDLPKPILYPVIGPTDEAMTRHFPMSEPDGEEHDHPHHRSIWFGHGLVNGEDFWTERASSGRIVHRGFSKLESGPEHATLRAHNDWISASGHAICADERTLTFHRGDTNARWIDFEITLRCTNGELVLGDTREGTMAVRVAESMRVTHDTGGHIETSEGQTYLEAWGRRAKWCDYSGPLGSGMAGIAILDHPENPRHPTWWMVRDYGLLAANPFGQHEFEDLDDQTAGEMRLPAGGSVTFRYRIVLHRGELGDAQLEQHFQNFANAPAR